MQDIRRLHRGSCVMWYLCDYLSQYPNLCFIQLCQETVLGDVVATYDTVGTNLNHIIQNLILLSMLHTQGDNKLK